MYYYFIIISVIAVILTVYDKFASKTLPKNRVPEKILLGAGFIGGAAAEYVCMKLIRHKTRHRKFMISLPIFTLLHILIIIAIHFNF